ncbi:hypothetical protein NEFER03_1445 [Nematocida sp. LUAm3]|nr:hypothetical protein NEFER03_1445 [Nematocida sp. LUAm3]KAI5174725.1 hypothetical protein NEFER02_0835 [Nematocida sp. LUAm2]KAI5177864.1 hypothetical protein NEFER01_1066 [Nematocida sp. LUAm1]
MEDFRNNSNINTSLIEITDYRALPQEIDEDRNFFIAVISGVFCKFFCMRPNQRMLFFLCALWHICAWESMFISYFTIYTCCTQIMVFDIDIILKGILQCLNIMSRILSLSFIYSFLSNRKRTSIRYANIFINIIAGGIICMFDYFLFWINNNTSLIGCVFHGSRMLRSILFCFSIALALYAPGLLCFIYHGIRKKKPITIRRVYKIYIHRITFYTMCFINTLAILFSFISVAINQYKPI